MEDSYYKNLLAHKSQNSEGFQKHWMKQSVRAYVEVFQLTLEKYLFLFNVFTFRSYCTHTVVKHETLTKYSENWKHS